MKKIKKVLIASLMLFASAVTVNAEKAEIEIEPRAFVYRDVFSHVDCLNGEIMTEYYVSSLRTGGSLEDKTVNHISGSQLDTYYIIYTDSNGVDYIPYLENTVYKDTSNRGDACPY